MDLTGHNSLPIWHSAGNLVTGNAIPILTSLFYLLLSYRLSHTSVPPRKGVPVLPDHSSLSEIAQFDEDFRLDFSPRADNT